MTESATPLTTVQVVVHDETGIQFNGLATALTSLNEQGSFDILPEHTNFITLISKELIIHQPDGSKKNFSVAGGVLHCFNSRIEVFLGVTDKRQPTSPK